MLHGGSFFIRQDRIILISFTFFPLLKYIYHC